MTYYAGDIPAEAVAIEPARNGEPIDLTPFTALDSEAVLRDFDGEIVVEDGEFLISFLDEMVVLDWPPTTPFAAAGIYTLEVTLVGADARERLEPVYFVAQENSTWHTLDTARALWSDATAITDPRLFQLLELARAQVEQYGTTLTGSDAIRANREAQLGQARNLLNAGRAESGEDGTDTFVLRPFPLDWMIKQILRPKRPLGALA
jgi:hypothetical protein